MQRTSPPPTDSIVLISAARRYRKMAQLIEANTHNYTRIQLVITASRSGRRVTGHEGYVKISPLGQVVNQLFEKTASGFTGCGLSSTTVTAMS